MITKVILDFETSGLNPYHDDIIEIAVKVMNSDKQFSKLIQPKSNECISEEISSLTGITNKMLHEEGIFWKEAYELIKPWYTLCEATSGNTGIAFAMLAAERGYKMYIIMPSNMSDERKQMLKFYLVFKLTASKSMAIQILSLVYK